ncbi:MAG: AFG1 family ATPase [Proteobacteria bacterium]|nr:AFG1 family ATPase [Pseudomonadota bacterium]
MSQEKASALRRAYERQLRERHLDEDPAQQYVLGRLEDLHARLEAKRASRSLLRHWLNRVRAARAAEPVTGLYLWGEVGRGKTWLMDLFYASLPSGEARRLHFHRFMREVHAQLALLGERESPLEEVAARIAADIQVLCFDELYVADIADAMILGGLFAALFSRGVTLVATSNVRPSELYKDGLQRARFLPAIRLLEENMEVLEVASGTDYRLRQLAQARIYLDSHAPDTAARLEALFAELAGQATQIGGTILVEGRPIQVVRVGNDAAWFDFEALCAGPRSQNDYIEIASEFQSVIVSGVPVLDSLREDPARRFVALVDEFYDRNVKLIVSAAAPPLELYRGARLTQIFERTASRLAEMQSVAYLTREHHQ